MEASRYGYQVLPKDTRPVMYLGGITTNSKVQLFLTNDMSESHYEKYVIRNTKLV